jgi:SAM-dependent methyltransferase
MKSILDEILKLKYVHSVELKPGVFTRENDLHPNVRLTKQLLQPIEFQSLACLDIGTRDGGIAFLMEKRGANPVFATDIQVRKQFSLLHQYLKSNIQYITDCKLYWTEDQLSKLQPNKFDIIVLSGVLYHIYDVLGTLAQMRNLLKSGGLLIVESACIESTESSLNYNYNGTFYNEPYTYWLPTTACLRQLLTLCSFEPLAELKDKVNPVYGDVVRYALTARAVKPSIAFNGNDWMKSRLDMVYGQDYANAIEYPLNYTVLESDEHSNHVPYDKIINPPNYHDGVMGIRDHIKRKLKYMFGRNNQN